MLAFEYIFHDIWLFGINIKILYKLNKTTPNYTCYIIEIAQEVHVD